MLLFFLILSMLSILNQPLLNKVFFCNRHLPWKPY